MTPIARTLAELRRLGYTADVVKRWNPWARSGSGRYDFLDVVAAKPGETGILGIRCRPLKTGADGNLRAWIAAGNRLESWRWARSDRKTWQLDRRPVNG